MFDFELIQQQSKNILMFLCYLLQMCLVISK